MMGTDMTISFALLVAAVGSVITIYNWYTGRKKETQEEDSKLEEIKRGLLRSELKIDTISATTADIKNDVKGMQRQQTETDKRLTIVERDLKTAFNRIDRLTEGKE